MKQLTIVLTAVLLLVAAALAEERATVFRGLAWGDPPEALGNYRIQEDDGRVKTYTKENDQYQLGPVRAISILYQFLDNRLFLIAVASRETEALERLIELRYGKPTYDTFREKLWTSVAPDTDVYLKNDWDLAIMIIASKSITEQAKKWQDSVEALEAQSAW